MEFEQVIGDAAEHALAGRMRLERDEIVQRVLAALVVDVLEADPRFYRRASFYGLSERRERDELDRRRAEEAAAEATAAAEPVRLAPLGTPFGDAA